MNLDKNVVRNRCIHFLHGHGPSTIQRTLLASANYVDPHAEFDMYGQGKIIEAFEQKVASHLGMSKGVFMPSGTMAQQIAARIWSDRIGLKNIGLHPTSHLLLHEENAFEVMHDLEGIRLGEFEKTLTTNHCDKSNESLSVLMIELPQRHNGGALPTWQELLELRQWTNDRNIKFHLDGARLWECSSYYQRPLSEICGLFDSVYVSFYKGLGAMGGAMLLGSESFAAESKIWLRRHGGNLVHLYPYVVSADLGFETKLPLMGEYFSLTQKISNVLRELPLIRVNPNSPHTNMMHLTFDAPQKLVEEAALETAEHTRTWLLVNLWSRPEPGKAVFEWYIGEGARLTPFTQIEEALKCFHEILSQKVKA